MRAARLKVAIRSMHVINGGTDLCLMKTEWQKVHAFPWIAQIVTRIINRVFVGAPLCLSTSLLLALFFYDLSAIPCRPRSEMAGLQHQWPYRDNGYRCTPESFPAMDAPVSPHFVRVSIMRLALITCILPCQDHWPTIRSWKSQGS
jgi:hypothetical protein